MKLSYLLILIFLFFFSFLVAEEFWTFSVKPAFNPGFQVWVKEWQEFLEGGEIEQIQFRFSENSFTLLFYHPNPTKISTKTLPFYSFPEGTLIGNKPPFPKKKTLSLKVETPLQIVIEIQSLQNASVLLLRGNTIEARTEFLETYFKNWIFHVQHKTEETVVSLNPEFFTFYLKRFFLKIESWELLRHQVKYSSSIPNRLEWAGSSNPLVYFFLAKENPLKLNSWLAKGQKLHPDPNSFLRLFADYAFAEGNYKWSLKALNQIAQVDEELFAKKGYILILLGQEEEAKELFLRVLKSNPKHELSLFNLGRIAFRKLQYHQALSYFQQAATLSPKTEFLRYIGSCYVHLGQLSKAENLFQKLRKKGLLDPLFVSDYVRVLLRLNRIKAARMLLLEAEKKYQNHPFLLLLFSEIALKEKDPQKAFALADAVRKKYPENKRAQFLIGRAYLAVEDIKQAEALIRAAYDEEPQALEVQQAMGELYFFKGEFHKALPFLAIEKNLYYGICLHYCGQLKESKQFLKKKYYQKTSLETAVPYLRLLMELDRSESFQFGNECLKKWPASVEILFYMGQIELLRKRYFLAKKYFNRCLKLFPDYEYFYFWLHLAEQFLAQPSSLRFKEFKTPWLNRLKKLLQSQNEKQPSTTDEWLEFYFYMGFQKIALGKFGIGKNLLTKCLETKKLDHIEFRFVLSYLK